MLSTSCIIHNLVCVHLRADDVSNSSITGTCITTISSFVEAQVCLQAVRTSHYCIFANNMHHNTQLEVYALLCVSPVSNNIKVSRIPTFHYIWTNSVKMMPVIFKGNGNKSCWGCLSHYKEKRVWPLTSNSIPYRTLLPPSSSFFVCRGYSFINTLSETSWLYVCFYNLSFRMKS